MVKVIRKYRKWAMGIFGVVLIVTFLFTGAGNSLMGGDPMKVTVAEVGGQKIKRKRLLESERELETLKSLVPDILGAIPDLKSGVHWMLLVHEADKAGLVGEAGDGEAWTEELAQARLLYYAENEVMTEYASLADLLRNNPQLLRNLALQKLNNSQWLFSTTTRAADDLRANKDLVCRRMGIAPEELNLALARLRGVLRLVTSYTGASARVSDAYLIHHARRLVEPATIDAIIIEADRILDEAPTPSDAEITAQYEALRSVTPGTPPHGLGYIQPRRVKLEWMRLSREAISKAIELDPVAVQKHYLQNRAKFVGEFAAERAAVEAELKDARIKTVLDQFDAIYKARIKAATRRLPVEGNVRTLDATWAASQPRMEGLAADVAQAVREATGVNMPLPEVRVASNSWTRLDRAGSLEGIGAAQFSSGTRAGSFPELLSGLHEFMPTANLGLQSRVPFDTMVAGREGDRYYFCVLDWREQSSPDSLDEVRDDVVTDLKRLWAYRKLAADLPKFEALASTSGLEAVGKLFETPAQGTIPGKPAIDVQKNVRITRTVATTQDPRFQDDAFRAKVMDLAAKVGWTTAPTPENAAQRTLSAELPAGLSVVVCQLSYPTPLTEETMRILRNELIRELTVEEMRRTGGADSPFSFESLKARTGFKDLEAPKAAPAPAA
ncbi:MAG: SurA N-terminal domain-containing protein [Phycisphaerales bacterium]|nr:SurA N-terminal domain-containing protein [Phycisphaerales bacterium]